MGGKKSSSSSSTSTTSTQITNVNDERIGVGSGEDANIATDGSTQVIDKSDRSVTNVDYNTYNTVTDHGAVAAGQAIGQSAINSNADIARDSIDASERISSDALDTVDRTIDSNERVTRDALRENRYVVEDSLDFAQGSVDSVERTAIQSINRQNELASLTVDLADDVSRRGTEAGLILAQEGLDFSRGLTQQLTKDAFDLSEDLAKGAAGLAADGFDLAEDVVARQARLSEENLDFADQIVARGLSFAATTQSDAIHQTGEVLRRGFENIADLAAERTEGEGDRSAKSLQTALIAGAVMVAVIFMNK